VQCAAAGDQGWSARWTLYRPIAPGGGGSMYRERELTRESCAIFGNIVANAGMRDHILALVSQNGPSIAPHAHAQVPSHRSPSVKRLRIHFKGMVGSPGWLDGFPEVGRR